MGSQPAGEIRSESVQGTIASRRLVFFGKPENSLIWLLTWMIALQSLPGVVLRCGDQCRLGAPWQKATGWLTNAPWLEVVERRHCDRTCPAHIKLVGKVLMDGRWI